MEREWLYSFDPSSITHRAWLYRDASRDSFRFPGGRVSNHKQLASMVRPDALTLSTAGLIGHPELSWLRPLPY